MSRARIRFAFTLVELLVVVAIIGILVALVLPAVQQAREVARRTECRNHLHQMGIALHTYHEQHKLFPPGWIGVSQQQFDVDGNSGFGWGSRLLNMLEQAPVYSRLNFSTSLANSVNNEARTQHLQIFRCPSDLGDDLWDINVDPAKTNPDLPARMPTASYVGCFGSKDLEECAAKSLGEQCVGDGAFYHNSSVRIRDIMDGTTTTILVGERKTDPEFTPPRYATWVGAAPAGERAADRILGETDHTPNHEPDHFTDFSSYHDGGAHMLLGDGSVKFVSNFIDGELFRRLGTINGSESILDDF